MHDLVTPTLLAFAGILAASAGFALEIAALHHAQRWTRYANAFARGSQ